MDFFSTSIPIWVYIVLGVLLLILLIVRYLYLRSEVNEIIHPKTRTVLKIAVPRNNEKSALASEQLYSALHGIIQNLPKSKHQISLELAAGSYGIYFVVVVDERYFRFIENQIYAQYPEAEVIKIKDYTTLLDTNKKTNLVCEIGLTKTSSLPIKTFNSFQVDPIASITAAISKLQNDEEIWIQTIVRPVDNYWQSIGKGVVNTRKTKTDEEGKKVALESGESEELREIERKNTKVGFQFVIRVLVRSSESLTLNRHLEDVLASYKQFQTPHLNSLKIRKEKKSIFDFVKHILFGKRLGAKLDPAQKFANRYLNEYENQIINIEELASIYHFPNKSVETPNIAWSMSKKLEPPLNLPDLAQGARLFGETDYRGGRKLFGIKEEDRKRHMYVIGKTGTGKSTLLKNMIMGDIYDNKGVAVIDPHGDLVDEIINYIPEHRQKDVIYFDPSDTEYPIGINLLDLKDSSQRDLVSDGIVEIFKKHFGHSWGPRLQYILQNTLLTLLECQNVSLLGVTRILSDRNYRKFLLKQVKDPILIQFWENEYENIARNPKMLAEVISPIQNKVGRFISSPMIRNIVGQVTSTLKIDEIMNSGKILLINLSQGKIGEENSALLGGMMVTKLFTSAMQRVGVPESERKTFFLYVDEFQNFTTNSFVKILSEARKYGLGLIIAHQYIDQLNDEIESAIFGNVGTIANFTVGQRDAFGLQKEYAPYVSAEDLVNLERYKFLCKLMVDGSQSKPFTAKSLKGNFKTVANSKSNILDITHQNFTRSKAEMEAKVSKWALQKYDEKGNPIN